MSHDMIYDWGVLQLGWFAMLVQQQERAASTRRPLHSIIGDAIATEAS